MWRNVVMLCALARAVVCSCLPGSWQRRSLSRPRLVVCSCACARVSCDGQSVRAPCERLFWRWRWEASPSTPAGRACNRATQARDGNPRRALVSLGFICQRSSHHGQDYRARCNETPTAAPCAVCRSLGALPQAGPLPSFAVGSSFPEPCAAAFRRGPGAAARKNKREEKEGVRGKQQPPKPAFSLRRISHGSRARRSLPPPSPEQSLARRTH